MEYEIVNLEEKKAVGISAVTNNKSPEMPKIIGGLWDEFYKKVYGEINDKANNKSIGMYHKYQPNGDYTVSICAEVNSTNQNYEVIKIYCKRQRCYGGAGILAKGLEYEP